MKILVAACLAACIIATGGTETIYAGNSFGGGGNAPADQNTHYSTEGAQVTYASFLTDMWFTRSGTSRDDDKNLLEVIVGSRSVSGFSCDSPVNGKTEYGIYYGAKDPNDPEKNKVLEYTNEGTFSVASVTNAELLKSYVKSRSWYGRNVYLGWATKRVRVYKYGGYTGAYKEYTRTLDLEKEILANNLTVNIGGKTYDVLPNQFVSMWRNLDPFNAMDDAVYEKVGKIADEKNKDDEDSKRLTEPQPGHRDGPCIPLGDILGLTPGAACTVTFNYNGGRDPYNKTSKTETYPVGQEIHGYCISREHNVLRRKFCFSKVKRESERGECIRN